MILLVLAALLAAPPESPEARVSLDVKDGDIADIVRVLAELGDFQVVIDPGLTCKLTLRLREVRWVTAFETTLRACGLSHEGEGGIERVATVARLQEEATTRRQFEEEKLRSGPLKLQTFRLSYARAQDLAPVLKKALSPRGDVFYDARTNTLFISD